MEIQLTRGAEWTFVAECPSADAAWNAIRAFARDYFAAQVIWPLGFVIADPGA